MKNQAAKIKIVNPWKTTEQNIAYYTLIDKPVYESEGIKIYKEFDKSHLYVKDGIAFKNLVGKNTDLVDNIVEGKRPENSPLCFLYDRAIKRIESNKLIKLPN